MNGLIGLLIDWNLLGSRIRAKSGKLIVSLEFANSNLGKIAANLKVPAVTIY